MIELYSDHHRLSLGIHTFVITLGATGAWCAASTLHLLSKVLTNKYGQLTLRWLFAHAKHLERSSRRSSGPSRILSREHIQKEIHSSEASRRQVICMSQVKEGRRRCLPPRHEHGQADYTQFGSVRAKLGARASTRVLPRRQLLPSYISIRVKSRRSIHANP
jgi:hypothetical protein